MENIFSLLFRPAFLNLRQPAQGLSRVVIFEEKRYVSLFYDAQISSSKRTVFEVDKDFWSIKSNDDLSVIGRQKNDHF